MSEPSMRAEAKPYATSAYLKHANPRLIVESVKQYGMLAFLGGGLTDIDIAHCAAMAINALAFENMTLSMFFTATTLRDNSFASIRYVIDDFNPDLVTVKINQIIVYKTWGTQKSNKILQGPLFPRAGAKEFVRMLNRLQCERDGQDIYEQAARFEGWDLFTVGEVTRFRRNEDTVRSILYDNQADLTRNWQRVCFLEGIDA
jgi:hypothetical protein